MKVWNPMKLIPSLTGEMPIHLYLRNRDGELKPRRGSEKPPSPPMSSTGKPVMTSSFANATPWFMDTMLPTIAISGIAEEANEIEKSLFPSRAWCLVLYSFTVASSNYINTYKLLIS
uniref:Matrix Gla protein n=1 Tax=Canis lupus dingo TaxID=286419 RepID=A0A8C0QWK5_CANLU